MSFWHRTYYIASDDLELLVLPPPLLNAGVTCMYHTSSLDSARDQAQGFMHIRQTLGQLNDIPRQVLLISHWSLLLYRNTIHFYTDKVSSNLVEPVISCRNFSSRMNIYINHYASHRIFLLSSLHTCPFSCLSNLATQPRTTPMKGTIPTQARPQHEGKCRSSSSVRPTGLLFINAPSDDQA